MQYLASAMQHGAGDRKRFPKSVIGKKDHSKADSIVDPQMTASTPLLKHHPSTSSRMYGDEPVACNHCSIIRPGEEAS